MLLLGYLKLNLTAAFPDEPKRNALLLDRIYILEKAMGKGVGKALMNHAVETAKTINKKAVSRVENRKLNIFLHSEALFDVVRISGLC